MRIRPHDRRPREETRFHLRRLDGRGRLLREPALLPLPDHVRRPRNLLRPRAPHQPAVLLALGTPDTCDPRPGAALPARARALEEESRGARRSQRRPLGGPAPRRGGAPLRGRPIGRHELPVVGARQLLPPEFPRERPDLRGARRARVGRRDVREVPRPRARGIAAPDAARERGARRAEDAAPAALSLQHAQRDRGAPEAEARRGREHGPAAGRVSPAHAPQHGAGGGDAPRGAGLPRAVPRDREDAFRGPSLDTLPHPVGRPRRPRAEPPPAAARRERDPPRNRARLRTPADSR